MSESVVVPTQVTIKSIDAALDQIHQYPDSGITISSSLSFRSILSATSYIQFLLSWAKGKSKREVILKVKNKQELDFLGTAFESFIPIALATEVKVNYLDTGSTEILDRGRIIQQGLDLFAQLQGGLPVQQNFFGEEEFSPGKFPRKGFRIPLLAADFAGSHESPNWFYKGSKESRLLRAPSDFPSLVRSVINLLWAQSGQRFDLRFDKLSNDLGAMLYELIDNTHKWGRQGLALEPCDSFRGVLFDVRFDHPGNKTKLADIASEIPLIGEYIKYHQPKDKTRSLGLLEMTVFDGGIGLPARELARRGIKKPTLAEEYAATLACLQKWGTTSQEGNRGLGLDRFLELASLHKGLVYLRTGSLALFRDFANKPDSEKALESQSLLAKYRLEDAVNLNLDPSPRQRVEGTLLSIVLPFTLAIAS